MVFFFFLLRGLKIDTIELGDFMKKIDNGSTKMFLIFLFLVLPLLSIGTWAYTGTWSSPDTFFIPSQANLFSVAEIYGQSGAVFYLFTRLSIDLIWPLVYYAFFLYVIKQLIHKEELKKLFSVILLVALIFDYLENISASIFLLSYPTGRSLLSILLMFFTSIKWLALIVEVIAILFFLTKDKFLKSKKK